MKTKKNQKPVRRCHNCGLNLGDHCGVYPDPREMWHHRACPGFQNQEMLREYEAKQAKKPADHARERRQETAKQRESEPHWQGTRQYTDR